MTYDINDYNAIMRRFDIIEEKLDQLLKQQQPNDRSSKVQSVPSEYPC